MKNLIYRAHAELFMLRHWAEDQLKKHKFQDLLKNKSGASMIEYSILIGLITAAVIATIVLVGGKVTRAWTTLNTNMQNGGMT